MFLNQVCCQKYVKIQKFSLVFKLYFGESLLQKQRKIQIVSMLKIAYNLIFHYKLFEPTLRLKKFSQVPQLVDKYDIKYLIVDKDDTLVPLNEFTIKDLQIKAALDKLINKGIFIIIVSNSVIIDQHNQPKQSRVDNIDLYLSKDKKPYNGQEIQDFLKNQKLVKPSNPQYNKDHVAVVGDRLLTDIHLANLMGWKSFLVQPLQTTTIPKHGIPVYLMRYFQNILIHKSNFKAHQSNKK